MKVRASRQTTALGLVLNRAPRRRVNLVEGFEALVAQLLKPLEAPRGAAQAHTVTHVLEPAMSEVIPY